MAENEEAFNSLKTFTKILTVSLGDGHWIPAERLRTIRDHIQLCDTLEKSPLQKTLFFIAVERWRKCYKRWLEYRKPTEKTVEMSDIFIKTRMGPNPDSKEKRVTNFVRVEPPSKDPLKPWTKVITTKDKKFLRSMRITPGDTMREPSSEEEDGDDDAS